MKYFFIFLLIFSSSCRTKKVNILDGYIVIEKERLGLLTKSDTVYYRTLWSGEIITEDEYDKRWDRALKRAKKQIEKEMKN